MVDVVCVGWLYILEVQWLIWFMFKVVICLVNGWVVGGGYSLYVVCDFILVSCEYVCFKQIDVDVGSFDGGYGSVYLVCQVGQKFVCEIFFLGCIYIVEQMYQMGVVNVVVEYVELEIVGLQWVVEINVKLFQV